MAEAEPRAALQRLIDGARKMTKGEKSGLMTLNFDWLYWPLFAMNGVELLVREAGPAEGPLVVLAHGFPELSYSWTQVWSK